MYFLVSWSDQGYLCPQKRNKQTRWPKTKMLSFFSSAETLRLLNDPWWWYMESKGKYLQSVPSSLEGSSLISVLWSFSRCFTPWSEPTPACEEKIKSKHVLSELEHGFILSSSSILVVLFSENPHELSHFSNQLGSPGKKHLDYISHIHRHTCIFSVFKSDFLSLFHYKNSKRNMHSH